MKNKCLIWNTPATFEPPGGDYTIVKSPRTGGDYRVAGSVDVSKLNGRDKAKLTEWLVQQRRNGDGAPLITSNTLAEIRSMPDLRVLERRNRALELLVSRSKRFGARFPLAGLVDDKLKTLLNDLQLATQSENENEARSFVDALKHAGLINIVNSAAEVTFEGWEYIERQRAEQVASVQAFVAMWFHASTQQALEEGIVPAIHECGYRVMRIDQKEHVNKIDDEIVREIRRSRFLVADFTAELEKPRGGVYFEAGFAIGLNKPVIWTCRTDVINFVHFDTRQFNHITWDSPADLYTKLKNRIGAILGQGPLTTEAAS